LFHQKIDTAVREALQNIKPHSHLCLIYDTYEEWHDIVIPFLVLGFERGDKCIYIVDTHTADQIRSFLSEEGVNINDVETSGQFVILTANDIYPENGMFDPDRMIALLKKETMEAINEGYNILRITGEMTRFLRSESDPDKLIEFEANLNYFFPEHPCASICQYDRKRIDPDVIKEVIMTHPILVRGSHIHRNFYYLPPNNCPGKKRSEYEVEHWLNNLENEYNMEEQYRRIVETANEGIWIIDADYMTTFVNDKLALMFGYTVEEMIGRSLFDFIDKKYWDIAKTIMKRRKLGVLEQYDFEFRRKDNSKLWVIVSATPFFDKDGCYAGSLGMLTDITERKQAERELKRERDFISAVIDTADCLVIVLDIQGRIVRFNRTCELITGYQYKEVKNKYFWDLFPVPEQAEMVKVVIEEICTGQFPKRIDNYWLINYSSNRLIAWSATALLDEKDQVEYIIATGIDITEREQAQKALQESNEELISANEELIAINEELIATEEELRQQYEKLQKQEATLAVANQRLQDIIEFLPDATFVIGQDKKVIAWNRAIEEMTGIPKEQILGKGDYVYSIPFYGKPRPGLVDFAVDNASNPDSLYDSFERKGVTLHGQSYLPGMYGGKGAYIWGIASPLYDKNRKIVGAIETIRDITEQKQLEERLKYLSLHDSLTTLHNRAYFEEEMRRVEGGRSNSTGIIVCDVDGLKFINDTLGHEAGDSLLLTAAGIIKSSFRDSDVVARIGGDEFAAILSNTEEHTEEHTVEAICKRIRGAIERYNATNPELPLSISVGFAARSEQSISINELFREADNKMYREKLYRAQSIRSAIVQTLMKMLQVRDFMTEEHAERLQILVVDLASAIGLPERSLTDLRLLAQFHDIGKVGVPDKILFKAGPLTAEETIEMRQHCIIGQRIAILAPDLVPIADWVLKHHEWWNGEGYPLGLKGEEIPLECRILAIVDAYDAMISDRPYRKALTHAEAIKELRKCSGTQFDPQLVQKFVQLLKYNKLE